MALLTDFVTTDSSNVQFASVLVSAVAANAGTNNLTLPTGAFKVPFNGIFANPYNICTLNTTLSTITLPSGLYNIYVTFAGTTNNTNRIVSTRLASSTTTYYKWPPYMIYDGTTGTGIQDRPGKHRLSTAGLYLASQTDIFLEQYLDGGDNLLSRLNDAVSNVYYRMDIWKLR